MVWTLERFLFAIPLHMRSLTLCLLFVDARASKIGHHRSIMRLIREAYSGTLLSCMISVSRTLPQVRLWIRWVRLLGVSPPRPCGQMSFVESIVAMLQNHPQIRRCW